MKKLSIIMALILGALVLFAGCSENTSQATDKKIVKVGTMGTYEPFSYQDEKGNLTGFDIEVLKALEPHLEDIEFEFIASPWDTLFIGLDSDKFQLLANQITSNPDREAKYALTTNSYFKDMTQPILRGDDTSIQSLADLKGKKVGTTVGDSHTRALEDYNKENGNQIIIEYYETDINGVLQDLLNKRIDATVNNPIMAKSKGEILNMDIKSINESIIESPTVFIAKKDTEGEELIKKSSTGHYKGRRHVKRFIH